MALAFDLLYLYHPCPPWVNVRLGISAVLRILHSLRTAVANNLHHVLPYPFIEFSVRSVEPEVPDLR